MTGFEPAAPSSRTKCATKLRYIPIFSCQVENFRFQRCATTSRKNNSPDCFFSAECYIPRYLVLLVGLEAHYVLPLRKRYLIVFFGRVKLRYIPIFSCQVENFRFQRCATTSRKNNSPDCFSSAECYIPGVNIATNGYNTYSYLCFNVQIT